MTAWAPGTVRHEGTEYSLAADDGQGLFDPADHGLKVQMFGTHQLYGYFPDYAVVDGALVLASVELGLGKEREAFGVKPRPNDDHPHRYHFDGVDLPVPFTGRLLLGHDFLSGTPRQGPFITWWQWRQVRELAFEEGRLVGDRDRSEETSRVREAQIAEAAESDPVPSWRELARFMVSRRYREQVREDLAFNPWQQLAERPAPPAPVERPVRRDGTQG